MRGKLESNCVKRELGRYREGERGREWEESEMEERGARVGVCKRERERIRYAKEVDKGEDN